jgi:hypothetical protein
MKTLKLFFFACCVLAWDILYFQLVWLWPWSTASWRLSGLTFNGPCMIKETALSHQFESGPKWCGCRDKN